MKKLFFLFLLFYSCNSTIHTVQHQDVLMVEERNSHQVSVGCSFGEIGGSIADLEYAYSLPYGLRLRSRMSRYGSGEYQIGGSRVYYGNAGLAYYRRVSNFLELESNFIYGYGEGKFSFSHDYIEEETIVISSQDYGLRQTQLFLGTRMNFSERVISDVIFGHNWLRANDIDLSTETDFEQLFFNDYERFKRAKYFSLGVNLGVKNDETIFLVFTQLSFSGHITERNTLINSCLIGLKLKHDF